MANSRRRSRSTSGSSLSLAKHLGNKLDETMSNAKRLTKQNSEMGLNQRVGEKSLYKQISDKALNPLSGSTSPLFKRAVLQKVISAKRLNLADIPLEVDVSSLNSNGLLLSDEDIQEIRESPRFKKSGSYNYSPRASRNESPQTSSRSYEIIKNDGKYYVVYPDATLGEGGFGKVLAIQNLETGDFGVLKIPHEGSVINAEALKEEHANLVKLKKGSPEILKDRNGLIMDLEPGMSVERINYWELNSHPEEVQTIMHPILRLHMATEIIKAIMKLHDNDLLHGDVNAGNILLDLFKHKAGIVDFANLMPPNTMRRVRGTAINFDFTLRNDLLRQADVRENTLPTYHVVGQFTIKSENYAVGIVVALLMLMFNFPDQNDVKTWEKDNSYVVDDLEYVWPDDVRLYYDQVLDVIKEVTNEKERIKRPLLKVFLEKLEAIKQQYIADTNFSLNTSLFDVDFYLSLSPDEQTKMLKDASARDEVILIDTKKHLLATYYVNKEKAINSEKGLERDPLTYILIKRQLETLNPNSLINLRVGGQPIAPFGDFASLSTNIDEANNSINKSIMKEANAYLKERQSIPFKLTWERKQSLSELVEAELQKNTVTLGCP